MQSRRRFAVGVRFWGKSMDGVFRLLLGRFIQRGTIIFTTAGGTTFTCGDGTGEQVHARLTSPSPSVACCSIPSSRSARSTWTAD